MAKKRSKKRKFLLNVPHWRQRPKIMDVFNDIQITLEACIGMKKRDYSRYFCMEMTHPEAKRDLEVLRVLIKAYMPDAWRTYIRKNKGSFGYTLRVFVKGRRPKLKRIRRPT